MPITFLQMAQRVLEEEKKPLTISEIWKIAVSKNYNKLVDSKGKTPWATLGALSYVDVRDNHSSNFLLVGSRPKQFTLKHLKDIVNIPIIGKTEDFHSEVETSYSEKDLHPFMVYYGFYYLKSYLKTIDHTKSDKKGYGEWIHPDIVGCHFPFTDWSEEVVDVSGLMGKSALKLFSFELKRQLSVTNLREAFFQAVSNSSWANEGYLVAAEIDTDEDFLFELKRLSLAFGIGVISLNIEDPDSTEILFPAKDREEIDWETVNKLSGMNRDYCDFLKRIRTDIKSREIRKELYDRVIEKNELLKQLNKKINV
jgi:uncharacterized protein